VQVEGSISVLVAGVRGVVGARSIAALTDLQRRQARDEHVLDPNPMPLMQRLLATLRCSVVLLVRDVSVRLVSDTAGEIVAHATGGTAAAAQAHEALEFATSAVRVAAVGTGRGGSFSAHIRGTTATAITAPGRFVLASFPRIQAESTLVVNTRGEHTPRAHG
jgi:hypothetical protein